MLIKSASARLSTVAHQLKQPETQTVLFERVHNTVLVTLNREKQLNPLDTETCWAINKQAHVWNDVNSGVRFVIFRGRGKAFCAGGDIKQIYNLYEEIQKDTEQRRDYVAEMLQLRMKEYAMYHNVGALQAHCKQLSFIDGLTFGGGAGLAMFGSCVVATENTAFAMPESKIGFLTDVGASIFLSRLRSNLGKYLALLGKRLDGQQMVALGLAHYYVNSQDIPSIIEQIVQISKEQRADKDFHQILKKYSLLQADSAESKLINIDDEKEINELFSADSYHQLLDNLQKAGTIFAQKTLAELQQQCPLSLRINFRVAQRPLHPSRKECYLRELRIVKNIFSEKDYFEGIRCVIKDKNDKPRWRHTDALRIDEALLDRIFNEKIPQEDELVKLLIN